ncbi:CPBP family intramembrane glutamic endopeptidase [Pseudoramibacter alactolyticus]|uniref:CPBP family intramembrane glutamic endopeptidase n=1 Tax=Pseudoramibacter alactolyticus TaxID=113287 RepID=UPI00248ECDE9|nr:CPBP family intramembrane glutamic endopeptidase [Pseudoramibacter alactolyticus]
MTNRLTYDRFRPLLLIALIGAVYAASKKLPILLQMLLYRFGGAAGLPIDDLSRNLNAVYVIVAAAEIIPLAVLYRRVFPRLWERPPEPKRRLSPAQSGLVIVLGAFGAMGLSMLWLLFTDGVLSALPFIHRQLTQFNQSMAAVDSGSYLWSFLAACVCGPIVEELIFRGLIFGCLRQLFKTPVWPVLISAALFGIWHENAVQAAFAGILGVIFAVVYDQTGCLWINIAIHMLNNFFATPPPAINRTAIPDNIYLAAVVLILPMIGVYIHLFAAKKPRFLQRLGKGRRHPPEG